MERYLVSKSSSLLNSGSVFDGDHKWMINDESYNI